MPTALVTGGAKGIGYAAASALIAAGFDLALVSLESEAEAREALQSLRSVGPAVRYWSVDISRVEEHAGLLRDVTAQFGPIHCLVNNAGVTSLTRGDLLDLSIESFD